MSLPLAAASSRRLLSGCASAGRLARMRFVILASEVNKQQVSALVTGATGTLIRAGVISKHIELMWVPGAFELPVVAARLVASARSPNAIIALGAIIRGQTPHYNVIAHAVAQGLEQVAVSARIPVTFGIIVATTLAQAKARAGGSMGNRGADAALAAIAVLHLFDRAGIRQRFRAD